MQDRLKNKAIIVVGSGSGIGAATVRRLAAEGARVCAADINEAGASAVAKEVVEKGGEAFSVQIDLADEASIQAAIATATKRLGGLDGAHINAADLLTIMHDSNALDEDLAVFDRTLAINLRGHLLCTRAVLPHLLTRGEGAIVYTSSGSADSAEPVRPAYAASKGGLNSLMRHVARCWGPKGITSNCVAPGFTVTPEKKDYLSKDLMATMIAKIPGTRLGRPEDIAGVAAMLLSEDGRWINGQVFNVNGGALMR